MIKREDFPEKLEDIQKIDIALSTSKGDDEATCPVSMKGILEYLDWESPGGKNAGGEMVIDFELKYLRTALVNDTKYWIWFFLDENDTECYVTIKKQTGGSTVISYDEVFGLTPEQFILVDYFDI